MTFSGDTWLPVLFLWLSLAMQGVSAGKQFYHSSDQQLDELKETVESLQKKVADLSKQMMMQQFYIEEKIRTDGNSGVKVVRSSRRGLKNYDSATHLSPQAYSIHDHSNYDRTVGLGEMVVVLNGVEFRTRHNDYKLVMPSTKSREYHAYENIPFPNVPPEVLKKSTISEQIEEMREWFKAFYNQDPSVRNYTQYFKPVMCYLEGAWTLDKNLEEPFPSDRHSLDAKSWEDLHMRNRFIGVSGVKHRLENIAFLPTTIMSVNESTGEAQYAQWNYRILCSPLKQDIPLSFFQQEDDLTFRMDTGQSIVGTAATRAARFKLFDKSRQGNYQIQDEIMGSIPGPDNYGANLSYTSFAEDLYDARFSDPNVPLNTAYYHRSYKSSKSGAGGISYAQFGFNDENCWVAQTSQPRIAPLQTEQCFIKLNNKNQRATRCDPAELRFTYAIPLELIFMTPLLSWNPYNIVMHDDTSTATKDGRNGDNPKQALDGIDKLHYYMTPAEFFKGNTDKSDPADTVRNYLYVLAPDGEAKRVSASGTRIFLPHIQGIEQSIRLRYPIAPVSGEGSSVWKELSATKDKLYAEGSETPSSVLFAMSPTVKDPPGEHTHEFTISYSDFADLLAGVDIKVTTEEAQEHTHELVVTFDRKKKKFSYTSCNGEPVCRDGHPQLITLITDTEFTKH